MTNLVALLEQSCTQHAERIALRIADTSLTYRTLQQRVYHLAQYLIEHQSNRVSVLGYRSAEVDSTIVACLYARTTYVPLNPRFPHERCTNMMANAQIDALVICPECAQYALGLHLPTNTLVFTDDATAALLHEHQPQWQVISIGSFDTTQETCPPLPEYQPSKPIYILYTSGTTGEAKGVVISYRAFTLYLLKVLKLYQYRESDVFSQMFELTFDPNLQDVLSAFISGGTLVPIPKNRLFAPLEVIKQYGITVFHTVPSLVSYLDKIKFLSPGLLPQVRLTLFAGEALWYEQVQKWGLTCPNSTMINTYGPTETTVIIATFKAFDPHCQKLSDVPTSGCVPLGCMLEHTAYSLRDEQHQLVPEGASGEIYVCGDQMGEGYLGSPEKTAASFIPIEGTMWYRTGDLGHEEIINGQKVLIFGGRLNDEVKISGFRVSLLEVDECLQKQAGVRALALPIRDADGVVHGLLGVLEGNNERLCHQVQKEITSKLPFYMVPAQITTYANFPANTNGKLDRKALIKIFTERGALTAS